MGGIHYPVPVKCPWPPLTTDEAIKRARGLMRHDYQVFGNVEARRVIHGLLLKIEELQK
jgi:hypothetical protein